MWCGVVYSAVAARLLLGTPHPISSTFTLLGSDNLLRGGESADASIS